MISASNHVCPMDMGSYGTALNSVLLIFYFICLGLYLVILHVDRHWWPPCSLVQAAPTCHEAHTRNCSHTKWQISLEHKKKNNHNQVLVTLAVCSSVVTVLGLCYVSSSVHWRKPHKQFCTIGYYPNMDCHTSWELLWESKPKPWKFSVFPLKGLTLTFLGRRRDCLNELMRIITRLRCPARTCGKTLGTRLRGWGWVWGSLWEPCGKNPVPYSRAAENNETTTKANNKIYVISLKRQKRQLSNRSIL